MSKKQASLENFFGGARNRTNGDIEAMATEKKKKVTFSSKYDKSYRKYGFIAIGN